jgi:uncharacterized protein (DUF1778 family)
VVAAVHAAAQEAIAQSQVIALSMADQRTFANALIAPPKLAPAMKRALAQRKKILREA